MRRWSSVALALGIGLWPLCLAAEALNAAYGQPWPALQQSIEAASASRNAALASRGVSAAKAPAQPELLDLNTATSDQLKVLPGMGAEYARRIIAGRPYSAKNQLVGRGVLPQPAYDRISGRVVAHRSHER